MNRKIPTTLGIHVYGIAAICLGVVQLVWKDFATAWQPVQPETPHRTLLVYAVGVIFILAGAAVQSGKTVRIGLPVLGLLHLLAALLWLPRVIGFPEIFGTWAGFNQEFSMVVPALMAFAALTGGSSGWARGTRSVCRVVYGICVVVFGLAHFFALSITASIVPKWIPPGQMFWAVATGVFFVLGGLAISSGIQAVLASRLVTAELVGFGLLVWLPRMFQAPHVHISWAGNAINLALTGAAWMVADEMGRSAEQQRV